MNILLISSNKSCFKEFKNTCNQNDCIYFLNIGTGKKNNTYDECVKLELLDEIEESIVLGQDFLLSYKCMLTFKKLVSEVNIKMVIFNCTYLEAYFTIQYIVYSGLNIGNIKIQNNMYNTLLGDVCKYKFPVYWIEHIEKECKELLNVKVNDEDKETTPLLSIIIPYYNLGKYIKESIKSIKQGSYSNYEIIVVNDGSDDALSKNILYEIQNEKKLCIINQDNEGLSSARNTGAKAARGKYITFLDADDVVKKDYYKRAIKVLEQYQYIDIVYSWVEFFDGKDEIWPTFNLTLPYLLLSNMTAAFYVIRKEKFIEYGLNEENMKKGMEDYDSLINMYKNGCKGVSIPEPLVKYRYRLGSMSKAFNPELVINIYNQLIENHLDVYNKYGIEVIKLINSNGPGYLWNNPTLKYPNVALNANEDVNDIKYILIKLLNTKIGKLGVKLLKLYKNRNKR